MELHRLTFWWRRLDPWLTGAVGLLIVAGIGAIFSAGFRGADAPPATLWRWQIVWAAIGIVAFLAAAATDYRRVGRHAAALYLLGLALLVWVLAFGREINGARRWLILFGVFVQPSEIAKLATILVLARLLSRPGLDPRSWGALFRTAVPAGLVFLLIAFEPDLGTALTLAPVTWVMALVAGAPPRRMLGLVAALLLLLPASWFVMHDYQRDRLRVFLDPSRDPHGAGWSPKQSAIAVGSGGLRGKGVLAARQSELGYIPRAVAPTDFIFPVIAEQTGFAGALTLLGLFALVVGRGIRTAIRANDKFGQLVAAGLATLLYFHVFVNLAMTIGLLPTKGLPLPLISYGGSFMITTLLGLGLLQSVYVRRHTT